MFYFLDYAFAARARDGFNAGLEGGSGFKFDGLARAEIAEFWSGAKWLASGVPLIGGIAFEGFGVFLDDFWSGGFGVWFGVASGALGACLSGSLCGSFGGGSGRGFSEWFFARGADVTVGVTFKAHGKL